MPKVRADRIATLYLFHPLRQVIRSGAAHIPILMYHSISRRDEGNLRAYYRTCTDAAVFAEQLRFLHSHGYRTIGVREAVQLMEGVTRGAERSVVLTFDDGYEDFYTTAFPMLNRYGYSATVFLPTAYIGETAGYFNRTKCLTWSQVRELRDAGIEFGSHTVTHPQLRTLTAERVEYEIRGSKDTIEQRLGCPVRSFSYPYAFPEADRMFRQRLRAILEEAGFENGVSTIVGTAFRSSDRFFLERLPVSSADDLRFFSAKLVGAYDWLHGLQYAYKRAMA